MNKCICTQCLIEDGEEVPATIKHREGSTEMYLCEKHAERIRKGGTHMSEFEKGLVWVVVIILIILALASGGTSGGQFGGGSGGGYGPRNMIVSPCSV